MGVISPVLSQPTACPQKRTADPNARQSAKVTSHDHALIPLCIVIIRPLHSLLMQVVKIPKEQHKSSHVSCDPETSTQPTDLGCVHVRFTNAAPHLPPPGRRVERKQNIQILSDWRAESGGGG